MKPQVIIDCFPESARRYTEDYAVVAIDVIRATTSAITAVASGRRCITVPSLEAMQMVAARLDNPLLVGELGGDMPDGFDMNNSPVELLERRDAERPVLLLSTSGTRLIHEARNSSHTLLACFRNCEATARYLVSGKFQRVAVIGAGSRGEFREEDQMCCAWIAGALMHEGWEPANSGTQAFADLWRGAEPDACRVSNSAKYLLRSGQEKDLDFVIEHVNDLDSVYFADKAGEIFECEPAAHPSRSRKALAATVGEVTIGAR